MRNYLEAKTINLNLLVLRQHQRLLLSAIFMLVLSLMTCLSES